MKTILYLVWTNEENCGGDDCMCDSQGLDSIFRDREAANKRAKMLWGGRVTEREIE